MRRCWLWAGLAGAHPSCIGLRGDVIVPLEGDEGLELRVTTSAHALAPYELASLSPKAQLRRPCERPRPGDVLIAAGGVPVFNGSLHEAIGSWQNAADSFSSARSYAFPLVEAGSDDEVHSVSGFMIVKFETADVPLTFAIGKGGRTANLDVAAEIAARRERRLDDATGDDTRRRHEAQKLREEAAQELEAREAEARRLEAQKRETTARRKSPKVEGGDPSVVERERATRADRAAEMRQAEEDALNTWARHRASSRSERYSLVRAVFEEDKGPLGLSFDASPRAATTVVSFIAPNKIAAKSGIRVGDELIELRWAARDDDGARSERVINASTLKPSQVRVELQVAGYPRTFTFYRRERTDAVPKQPAQKQNVVERDDDDDDDAFVFRVLSPDIIRGNVVAAAASWAPTNATASCDDRGVVVLADPADGCAAQLVDRSGTPGRRYALASRGKCTFVDKARALQHRGADALIVYNTDASGLADMPNGGVRTDDIRGPVVMIDNAAGTLLSRVLKWDDAAVIAWLGPKSRCAHLAPSAPPPIRPQAADVVADPIGGQLHLQCRSRRAEFAHVAATFGSLAPDVPLVLAVASPPELCSLKGVERRLVGMAALVLRGGGCNFADKALVAHKLGAAVLIVVNNAPAAEVMMADPSLTIPLPSIMVSRNVQDVIDSMLRDGCNPAGSILARITYDLPESY
ncbi:hypothetical protein CTAYLR_005460 [Chrysophaeum taylorii]|uniref:PA domain-containing protein n=1 Tax=Chrysophaeum taylorii TaxID=2483200 RepID=A0AAD7UKY8_9STRA|nr:hypothetical protein CTAYLR_005460 [Chrysophaeum taylorii]